MVLVSVVTTTHREVHWVTRDVGQYFPEAWMRFREGLPEADRDGDLIAGYVRLLHDPDRAVGRRRPKIGVVGRTHTSRSIPTPSPARAMRTRDFAWRSRDS